MCVQGKVNNTNGVLALALPPTPLRSMIARVNTRVTRPHALANDHIKDPGGGGEGCSVLFTGQRVFVYRG